jgi:galactokinase
MNQSPVARAKSVFQHAYGGKADALIHAPGRVNIIGEHTDYNDGFVLPCAINFGTAVAIRRRVDSAVRLIAVDYNCDQDSFDLLQPITFNHEKRWANYARGMIAMMMFERATDQGADIVIAGNVPQGAGLSSSASLEVAIGFAWQIVNGSIDADKTHLAELAQRAENEFVGTNCGIMDQLISAQGKSGHALLVDCRSLQTQAVPMPPELTVLIVHSGVDRGLVDSEYNTRRTQCESAARFFKVNALRDVDETMLNNAKDALDATTYQRARHVITENKRTLSAADALKRGNLTDLGELLAASHRSMRDDFEITVPAIDRLVDVMQTAIGPEGGARMTGGGFGGCCVGLMPTTRVDQVIHEITRAYLTPLGEPPKIFVCKPSKGVGLSV